MGFWPAGSRLGAPGALIRDRVGTGQLRRRRSDVAGPARRRYGRGEKVVPYRLVGFGGVRRLDMSGRRVSRPGMVVFAGGPGGGGGSPRHMGMMIGQARRAQSVKYRRPVNLATLALHPVLLAHHEQDVLCTRMGGFQIAGERRVVRGLGIDTRCMCVASVGGTPFDLL